MVEQVLCPTPINGTKEIMIFKVEAPKRLSKHAPPSRASYSWTVMFVPDKSVNTACLFLTAGFTLSPEAEMSQEIYLPTNGKCPYLNYSGKNCSHGELHTCRVSTGLHFHSQWCGDILGSQYFNCHDHLVWLQVSWSHMLSNLGGWLILPLW